MRPAPRAGPIGSGFLVAIAGRGPEPFAFAQGARVRRLVGTTLVSAAEGAQRDKPGGAG